MYWQALKATKYGIFSSKFNITMDDLYQCVKCDIDETMNQSGVIDLGKDVYEKIYIFLFGE